jgi:hypothetical protein
MIAPKVADILKWDAFFTVFSFVVYVFGKIIRCWKPE